MPGYLADPEYPTDPGVQSTPSLQISVYADATARDADNPTPQIGDFAYTSDNQKIYFWTGSAWTIVNQEPDAPAAPDAPMTNYADAAARDAGETSPTEGKMVYLEDIEMVQVYNGTTWKNVGPTTVNNYGSDINPMTLAGM